MLFEFPKVRVEWSKTESNGTFTKIVVPAPDEFSKPMSIKCKSASPIGNPESLISVKLRFSGYVDERPYNDKSTGQRLVFTEQKSFFDVVEFGPVSTK